MFITLSFSIYATFKDVIICMFAISGKHLVCFHIMVFISLHFRTFSYIANFKIFALIYLNVVMKSEIINNVLSMK